MKRIAIIGGGISGLTAAYELELARKRGADIDWHLYEASDRLGGTIETTRHITAEGEWILEGGPDGWVSEKPWARELALELGLEEDLVYSKDAERKTYILIDGKLQAMPDHMRMFVPEDLATLEGSPLFSDAAKQAYANEISRATELKASVPDQDESVASFVQRHFGEEVLAKIAAPLLSGVFGGDVDKLSVQAVMPIFVTMEREHGSLIMAARSKWNSSKAKPIFTSLKRGMASLTEALVARLPAERVHLNYPAYSLKREGKLWCLRYHTPSDRSVPGKAKKHFRHVILAASADATRATLEALDPDLAALLPSDCSSAVLASFTWTAKSASTFSIPRGFGFLVPQTKAELRHADAAPHLLACTFVEQKYAHRAPDGARVLRAFFGTGSAEHFANASDAEIAAAALAQLGTILGALPAPEHTVVRRWPRSLPQYEVGHLDRTAQLHQLVARLEGLHLLGNSFRGVGLPDLIRDARSMARNLT